MSNQLYCHVVFGPERSLGVWFILDGNSLYIDCSGDMLPKRTGLPSVLPATCPVELADADGRTRYTIISAVPNRENKHPKLFLVVDIAGPVQYRQYGIIDLAEQPQLSGVAHVHGPLRVHIRERGRDHPPFAFGLDGKLQSIQAMVTTSPPNSGSWVAVSAEREAGVSSFPVGVCPVAVIDFPTATPETLSIRRHYTLDKVC